jgi:DNA helicase HerA-like ATPase
MGWKLSALLFLVMLFALLAGAFVIALPLLLYFGYKLWSNQSRSRAGSSHLMIYGGVLLLILGIVGLGEQGTYSPIVFGGSGLGLLAWGLFPGVVHRLIEGIRGGASGVFGQRFGKRSQESDAVPCVELTKMPLNHADPKKDDIKERFLRFQRLAQTLAEVGEAVEFRLDFVSGSCRATFTVGGAGDSRPTDELLLLLKSQLPEFGPVRAAWSPPVKDLVSMSVEGVPEPTIDPIGPLAKFFAENRLDGEYSVTVSPAHVSPVSRWLARSNQRKLAEDSSFQHVDDDRTTTTIDHPKQVELDESVKRLERLSARAPVKVSVKISARDESTAMQATHALTGALSSQRMIDGMRIGRPRPARRPGWQRSTLMLPSEAAALIWLPENSLGMKVAPSAEFQLPPATDGEIILGDVVTLSGRNGQQVRIQLDQLAKHIFVTGMTGSGKTTSCFSLLLQLHRRKIPFLVVEPAKSEYRSLMATIPELQVFTIGDEETAPFRLNIFEPPPGVKVQAHLEQLEAVWNSSFVSYAPLPYVVKQVFAEAYKACDWDVARNVRGRPVRFDDVRAQVERVVRSLGYERDVTMNVEAALKTRLTSLTLGGKGPLFGADSSTPLEEVLGKPTVVELKDVQNDEEKAFIAALLLSNIASWAQAQGLSRHLRHFTLIEEAHRLLPNVSTEKGDPEAADPRRRTVEQFGNMLAELRAYGEGLAVVEQIPTKILPDAIKNTATKVVHRVPALDDRRAMAGATNATREQAAVLTALRPGEAVLGIEGHPVPVRAEVEDVVARLGVPVGEVKDWDVKRRMTEFYLRNPLTKEPSKARDVRIRELVESGGFRAEFLQVYRKWLAEGQIGPLRDFLVQRAEGLEGNRDGVIDAAANILYLAVAFYLPYRAEVRHQFPRVFRKELEAAVRND